MGAEESTTRITMFERLRSHDNAAAWRAFESSYGGMLMRFCRSRGLQHADAEDVVQMVFAKFTGGVQRFEYDPARGRFRDYLITCTKSALSDFKSRQKRAGEAVDLNGASSNGHDADLEAEFERQWVLHHYRTAIDHISRTMDDRQTSILHDALRRRPVREIAADHGMTEAAVYKTLQRLRDRLRERIAEQIRDEDGTP